MDNLKFNHSSMKYIFECYYSGIIEDKECLMNITGLLYEEEKLLDIKFRLKYMLNVIENNLIVYNKNENFIEDWNKIRLEEYYLNQRKKEIALSKELKNKYGFIYLMKDISNNRYKVGFSKDPNYREKTLQSEKPDIVLLNTFKGTYRDEKSLHLKYSEFRIRGEWFDFPDDILNDIIIYFENKSLQ